MNRERDEEAKPIKDAVTGLPYPPLPIIVVTHDIETGLVTDQREANFNDMRARRWLTKHLVRAFFHKMSVKMFAKSDQTAVDKGSKVK